MTCKVKDKARKLAAKQKAVNKAIRNLSDHGYLDKDLQPEQFKYLPSEMFKELALVLSEFSDKNWSECLGYVLLAKGDFGYKGHSINSTYSSHAREIITSYLKLRSDCLTNYDVTFLKHCNDVTLLSLGVLLYKQQEENKDKLKRNLIKYIGDRDPSKGRTDLCDRLVLLQCAKVFGIEKYSDYGDIIKSVQQIGESYKTEQPKRLKRADNPITKPEMTYEQLSQLLVKAKPIDSVCAKPDIEGWFSEENLNKPCEKTLDALVQELEQSIDKANRLQQEAAQKLSEAKLADSVVNKLQEEINKRLMKSVNGKLVLIREEYEQHVDPNGGF